MAHLEDRWYATPRGSKSDRRRRSSRYGRGRRWKVRWVDPATGRERSESHSNRDLAERRLQEVRLSTTSGRAVPPVDRLTVDQWWEVWAARRSWKESTATQQRSRWACYVSPVIGRLPLDQVTRQHLVQVDDAMLASDLAAQTRRTTLSLAASVFRAAVVEGHLATDPSVQLAIPPRPRGVERQIMETEDVDALVAHLPAPFDLVAEVMRGTGARPNETRSLTVDRLRLSRTPPVVRIDRQLIGAATRPGVELVFGPPKGGARGRRDVAVTDALADRLREHVDGRSRSSFVFESDTYPGRPLNPRTLSDIFRDAAHAAGLDPEVATGWHALRHHHASLLLSGDGGRVTPVSLPAVSRRQGHSSVSVTADHYAHVLPGDEGAVLRVLGTG